MSSIKISQLTNSSAVGINDSIPIARGNQETYKTPASQFVTDGENLGAGSGSFFATKTSTTPTRLQFRSLSAAGENLAITTAGNTVVISMSGQTPVKAKLTGNGITANWALPGFNSTNSANYRVDIDGVLQEPGADGDYVITGGNIVFTTPPPSAGKIVVVTSNIVRLNEAVISSNYITFDMFATSTVAQITSTTALQSNTLPWRFVSTTNFNISASERIGTNTTSGALTGFLPTSPSQGTTVTVADISNTWSTYNLTVARNGSTISGLAENLICDVSGQLVTLVYTNAGTWCVLT